MNEFKEYLRFPDLEKSLEYTSVLDDNKIPFELDDSGMRYSPYVPNEPWASQYILKLRDSDIEQAEKLFKSLIDKEEGSIPTDHYLYSFSDKDIQDIIANRGEWNEEEIKIAVQIARERKINLSPITPGNTDKVSEVECMREATIEQPWQKPRKLKITIFLLMVVFISSVGYGMTVGFIEEMAKKNLKIKSDRPLDSIQFLILFLEIILYIGGPIFLLYKINSGKNWARTLYSFVTTLSIIYFFIYFKYYFTQNLTSGIISTIQAVMEFIALQLLYSKEVNKWYEFKSIKPQVEIVKS
ncbi:MAG: hypothetical protein ABI763_14735 [Bacteroidota bacterium]